MPTSPLPNFAGGRPLPAAIAAAGVRALSRAPPPTSPPPASPAFFRNPALVSPSSASVASCAASRTTASISELIVLLRGLDRFPQLAEGRCRRITGTEIFSIRNRQERLEVRHTFVRWP